MNQKLGSIQKSKCLRVFQTELTSTALYLEPEILMTASLCMPASLANTFIRCIRNTPQTPYVVQPPGESNTF